MLAATVRLTRDLDLAEECAQDAFAKALRTWAQDGIPARPGAWLTTVARNRALDLLRRETTLRRVLPSLVVPDSVPGPEDAPERPAIDDDRLRLIFTCCHPALAREAQVALTLRLLCGLSTAEVARAFLVSEPTMATRVSRAKKKIATARIPYRVPSREELPARLGAVLEVLHLLFTTGHTTPIGAQLVRQDLVDRAIGLTRLVGHLLPDRDEVAGLLALMLLNDARRETRFDSEGRFVALPDQDRSRWDQAKIAAATDLLATSLRRRPTRYAVEAAIAAVHAEAATWEATDWTEIAGLYDVLGSLWPVPVVALNRAVAIGMRDGPAAGLAALDPLLAEPALATYAYLSAARADFLRRLERWPEAVSAYAEALALTDNDVERVFLTGRLAEVRANLGE
ncbi:RNA polymerase sigma factor [Hamadaea flava]|uniref:RNA polymerase sigma factor n=1 Tax=Hamadaea flava TaxID=1742688 RepID=A0ABV8LHQ5_9ACTN|nr:sigma-70 family RNA polymerase sigma factor [Hamadaea flava]